EGPQHLSSETRLETGKEEVANRGRPAQRLNIRSQHQSISRVDLYQILELFVVTGQRPILCEFSNGCFGATQRRPAGRSAHRTQILAGTIAACAISGWDALHKGGARLPQIGTGRKIVVMIVVVVMVLPI